MFRKISILAFISLFALISTYGQDLHFTQFFRLPGQLSPALQGNALYQFQAALDYREQWQSLGAPYQTLAGDLAYRFNYGFDHVSATLTWSTDQSGAGQLQMNRLHGGLAYQHQWDWFNISIGLQLGLIQMKMNEATFPRQYDPSTGYFDLSINNGENLYNRPQSAPDLNSGLAVETHAGQTKINASYGLYHVNTPDFSLSGTGSTAGYPMRHQFFVQAETPLAALILNPMLYYSMQDAAQELVLGMNAYYQLPGTDDDPVALSPGLFWRNNVHHDYGLAATDALMVYTGLLYHWLDLGLSYDLNVSGLRDVSHYRGGFELSLAYRYKVLHEYKQITVPCIRY